MGDKTRRARVKSRRNINNKRTQQPQDCNPSTSQTSDECSSSAKKLKLQNEPETTAEGSGNAIVSTQLLTHLLQMFCCIECGNPDTKVNISPV